jgi:hypothetical protein
VAIVWLDFPANEMQKAHQVGAIFEGGDFQGLTQVSDTGTVLAIVWLDFSLQGPSGGGHFPGGDFSRAGLRYRLVGFHCRISFLQTRKGLTQV